MTMYETDLPVKLPHKSLLRALTELWEARTVVSNLVRRDFASQHKNSFLGIGWSLLNPLLLVAIYAVAFTVLLGVKTMPADFPYPFALYLYSGLIIWNVFSTSLVTATTSITDNAYLINRVYVPREVFPVSLVLSAGVTFLFEFAVLLVFMAVFGAVPGIQIVLAPLFLFLLVLISVGMALCFSTMGVRFRDLRHLVAVILQAGFWATPIVYSTEVVTSHLGHTGEVLLMLNPITPIIEGVRASVVLGQWPQWGWLAYSFGFGAFLCLLGYWYFQREEPYFPELI